MKLLLTIITLFLTMFTFQDQRPEFFEGKVIYALMENDGKGSLRPALTLSKMADYYKDTMYKSSILEGTAVQRNFGELVANTSDTTRFNVNSTHRIATSLGMEPVVENYIPKEITFVHDQDSILGHPCKKYKVIQRDYMGGKEKASYVWVAEDLRVKNLPLLGRIFGYRNTLIKNGTFGGITLKVEMLDGSGVVESVTSAVEIVPMHLDKAVFEIPKDYTIR